MAKTIVVCGATGGLGGSVARHLLKEGWHVRGITRNKDSAGAKALVEAGAELASADYDDVASLEAAFQGAKAVFGVTNFFEYMLEKGALAAAKKETQQLVNIATAADKIETLEHLILHTLPSGEKLGGKEHYVPHMDGKDQAADDIKDQFPELAKKTTFLWVGLFTSNFWSFPMMKPTEIPGSYGAHITLQPVSADTHIYYSGDVDTNIGVFASAILAKPHISTPAKYAFVYTEQGPYIDYYQAWSEVTGKRVTFVQVGQEQYESVWGKEFGEELAAMFRSFEPESDWGKPYGGDVVTAGDLGIGRGELLGLKETLEREKHRL
ncbi:hypothetical protein Q7P35_001496 [Cladosporium inversicolor]